MLEELEVFSVLCVLSVLFDLVLGMQPQIFKFLGHRDGSVVKAVALQV